MPSPKKKVLVVFIDAFGPEQLSRFGERLSFLPHHKRLDGILGYSSGALPTILTGAPPAQHGRMCLFAESKNQKTSILRPLKWLGLLPRLVHERSRVRRVAEKLLTKAAKLEGYVALHRVPPELFDWLDMPEREDMFQSPDIGGAPTFLSDARRAGLSVYAAPWQLPEAKRWEHAHQAMRSESPDLTFLYATEMDAIMHREGPNGPDAEAAFDRISSNIARARELLAEDGSPLLTMVIGDHGMARVHTFVDPRKVLSLVPHVRLFVDSTMIRAWGSDSDLSQLRREIERAGWQGSWLAGDVLVDRRVPKNDLFGRAMFVLPEGAIFAPSFLGGRVNGMHGYDVNTTCSKAALASDAPIGQQVTGIDSVAGVVRQNLDLS